LKFKFEKKEKKKKKAMRLGRHCSFSAHFIHPPRGPITPTPARAVTLLGPSLTSGVQSSSSFPSISAAGLRTEARDFRTDPPLSIR
jgi:hypothetical protein